MIMKNEEDELPLVLASAVGIVDEIVIYDTGSTDRSVRARPIARRHGDRGVLGRRLRSGAKRGARALLGDVGALARCGRGDPRRRGGVPRPAVATSSASTPTSCRSNRSKAGASGFARAFHAARVFRRDACHWRGPHPRADRSRETTTAYPATALCCRAAHPPSRLHAPEVGLEGPHRTQPSDRTARPRRPRRPIIRSHCSTSAARSPRRRDPTAGTRAAPRGGRRPRRCRRFGAAALRNDLLRPSRAPGVRRGRSRCSTSFEPTSPTPISVDVMRGQAPVVAR